MRLSICAKNCQCILTLLELQRIHVRRRASHLRDKDLQHIVLNSISYWHHCVRFWSICNTWQPLTSHDRGYGHVFSRFDILTVCHGGSQGTGSTQNALTGQGIDERIGRNANKWLDDLTKSVQTNMCYGSRKKTRSRKTYWLHS